MKRDLSVQLLQERREMVTMLRQTQQRDEGGTFKLGQKDGSWHKKSPRHRGATTTTHLSTSKSLGTWTTPARKTVTNTEQLKFEKPF